MWASREVFGVECDDDCSRREKIRVENARLEIIEKIANSTRPHSFLSVLAIVALAEQTSFEFDWRPCEKTRACAQKRRVRTLRDEDELTLWALALLRTLSSFDECDARNFYNRDATQTTRLAVRLTLKPLCGLVPLGLNFPSSMFACAFWSVVCAAWIVNSGCMRRNALQRETHPPRARCDDSERASD